MERFTGKRTGRRALAVMLVWVVLLAGCGSVGQQPQLHALREGSVSYLGPEGTYTEEAARCFLGEERTYLPQETVAQAVERLLAGDSVYAVIPQENTLGGPVYNYVDELLAHGELSVVGEVELPIRQALLAAEGTATEDITVVYSHPQGIVQGAAWLAEHLPEAEVVEVSSTAEGARMVAESGRRDCAAIASTGAAEVYGLQVLAESIQQSEANKTRFYVLSTDEAAAGPGERMVFAAAGEAEELPKLLEVLSDRGLQLVFLHDRPEKTELGSYIYLVECENGSYRDFEKISELPEFTFRYYGAFSVMQP